jgi:hypothetical protein
MITPEEFHDTIDAARRLLLPGGSANTFLLEHQALELQRARDEVEEDTFGDELIDLMPAIEQRSGSEYYSIRRMSAYIWYGQLEAALIREPRGARAQRFATDLKAWPGAYLPNELVDLYNRFVDDARETGAEDTFIVGDVKATPKPSGSSGTPGVYAQATLEACAAALTVEV